ncbi:hypothetical protein CspeluHIS016_0501830 [Cutaneotrichosporon spelunceum]|uniref:Uncharacterized protein n=1 Tax=Cutaneotrichosporon spelunceum TaxID=1672016 RepID=A0AAD3TWH4_9TREE|nr:hypothetical protein CspeluHIS016_0501830 [Cutaneotrichosporon spelunceum]
MTPDRQLEFEKEINANLLAWGVSSTYNDLQKDLNLYDREAQGIIIACVHNAACAVDLYPVYDEVCLCEFCKSRKHLNTLVKSWAEEVARSTAEEERKRSKKAKGPVPNGNRL